MDKSNLNEVALQMAVHSCINGVKISDGENELSVLDLARKYSLFIQSEYILSVEQIAQVAHEINKAYCEALGDFSQPSWDDAPDWQKESAINEVKFHQRNPNAGPEASHESWLAQKNAEGWKYGEEKDPENKLHPCMVPFKELPPEQQAKDYLFRQVVHSLTKGA